MELNRRVGVACWCVVGIGGVGNHFPKQMTNNLHFEAQPLHTENYNYIDGGAQKEKGFY